MFTRDVTIAPERANISEYKNNLKWSEGTKKRNSMIAQHPAILAQKN